MRTHKYRYIKEKGRGGGDACGLPAKTSESFKETTSERSRSREHREAHHLGLL